DVDFGLRIGVGAAGIVDQDGRAAGRLPDLAHGHAQEWEALARDEDLARGRQGPARDRAQAFLGDSELGGHWDLEIKWATRAARGASPNVHSLRRHYPGQVRRVGRSACLGRASPLSTKLP